MCFTLQAMHEGKLKTNMPMMIRKYHVNRVMPAYNLFPLQSWDPGTVDMEDFSAHETAIRFLRDILVLLQYYPAHISALTRYCTQWGCSRDLKNVHTHTL